MVLNIILAFVGLILLVVFGTRTLNGFGFRFIPKIPVFIREFSVFDNKNENSKTTSVNNVSGDVVVSNGQLGGITAHTVNINKIATYTVVGQSEKFNGNYYQISPKLLADGDILPSRLCIIISTNVSMRDFDYNIPGVTQGTKGNNSVCIINPPREFTPLITLDTKPDQFSIRLINQ